MSIYAGNWMHDSGAAFFTVGQTYPASAGEWFLAGNHNGQPYWINVPNSLFLWWADTRHIISPGLDVLEPGYWRQTAGGPPIGYYQPMVTYYDWARVVLYDPTPHDRNQTPVSQLGGGASARMRRLRPNEQPTVRQINARHSMGDQARAWDERMTPALQAEWLATFIDWHSYYGVLKLEECYQRFCNVNLTLAHGEEQLIVTHTGRRYLDVEFVSIEAASEATQIITTLTSVRQNFEYPTFTLLSFFQVWPLAVDGPRFHWYKRLLGVADALAAPFQPDWTHMQHEWLAAWPLVQGDMVQVVLRYTSDNDPGVGLGWAPFTRMHVSQIPEVGP